LWGFSEMYGIHDPRDGQWLGLSVQ
jgi:hypothetical protein